MITRQLDACLLTGDELASGEAAWEAFEDPFDPWPLTDDADDELVIGQSGDLT